MPVDNAYRLHRPRMLVEQSEDPIADKASARLVCDEEEKKICVPRLQIFMSESTKRYQGGSLT